MRLFKKPKPLNLIEVKNQIKLYRRKIIYKMVDGSEYSQTQDDFILETTKGYNTHPEKDICELNEKECKTYLIQKPIKQVQFLDCNSIYTYVIYIYTANGCIGLNRQHLIAQIEDNEIIGEAEISYWEKIK